MEKALEKRAKDILNTFSLIIWVYIRKGLDLGQIFRCIIETVYQANKSISGFLPLSLALLGL